MTDCIFCRIVAGEIPCKQVYADDTAIAFLDLAPFKTGHTLVVPRAHVADALSDAEDFGAQPLASERWRDVLQTLANSWHWAILVLAAAGLWWVPAYQRALPI